MSRVLVVAGTLEITELLELGKARRTLKQKQVMLRGQLQQQRAREVRWWAQGTWDDAKSKRMMASLDTSGSNEWWLGGNH